MAETFSTRFSYLINILRRYCASHQVEKLVVEDNTNKPSRERFQGIRCCVSWLFQFRDRRLSKTLSSATNVSCEEKDSSRFSMEGVTPIP